MEHGLYETLTEYSRGGILPLHMPGHKRNPEFVMENPYQIDVTEVEGLDDLHHPSGVIRQLMERVTKLYCSEQSYLLVNGSTGGILAAVAASCRHGDTIILARNCHTSVYHAVRLLELRPIYLYPDGEGGERERLGIAGTIRTQAVEAALREHSDAACVMITSPTYEGVVSPVREIAEVTGRYHVPLIVDEAHGAHFNWHPSFPAPAFAEGADVVVESLHKTLPSLTQTAVLHARFERISREKLEWCLRTFQSSSPSYVLMAGIDRCFTFLEREGTAAFDAYVTNLHVFCEKMRKLKQLYLFESPQKEPSKLVIATDRTNICGRELAERLRRQYQIETEMSSGHYCIAMTSVCDEPETFHRLAAALQEIDAGLDGRFGKEKLSCGREACAAGVLQARIWSGQGVERALYSYEAAECQSEYVLLEQAEGRTAAETVYFYPPGIPLLVQGEVYSAEVIRLICDGVRNGYEVHGIKDGMAAVVVQSTDCL